MKKWWLIVLVFFACGYVTPLYANLPCEDGCEDECDCDDEKEEETENENDGGPGNDSPQSGSGGAKRGSVSIWVNWGGPANENIKGQYRLSIYAKKPTPMIYTPQIIQYRNLLLDRVNISEINQLYKQEIRGDRYASEGTIYSDGKVVRILSDGGGQEKIMTSLASDVTHLIKILAADREMMTFQFKDGSAVGTMIGETATMNYRLVMVDGSGNPTTTNPVYYDRYLGYGNFLRYSVETGNVVSYHTATGRIITPDAPTVGVEPIYEEDGTIRQVWSLGDGLADIVVTETAISYEIRCYSPDKVGAKVDGLYTVTGAPHTVWRIENPTPGTNTNVKVTKIVNGVAEVSLFEYSHNAEGWLFRKPGDLAIESETTSWDYSQTVKVVTTIEKTPEGQVASKVARTYQKYPFGDRIVNVSVDPDGVNLRTQTTYYTDSADSGSYGRKKTESFSDGNWVSYEYDNQGRKIATITPWKNAVFNSPATQARTEYFSYIPHDSRDIVESDDIRPRTEEIKILGITTSKTYHAYFFDGDEYVEIEERCVNSSAAYGDSSNLRIERRYYPKGDCSSPSAGRIHTIKYPDGTMDTYTYEYGTWTPNSDPAQSAFVAGTGVAVKVNITHGTVDAPQGIPNKTIRDSEVFDSRGCKVYWTQAVFTNNGYETYAWGANSFDESRRLISELESNNELTEYTWNCCNIASKILPDGTQYTYVYDSLNRLVSKTKIGVGEQPDLVINYTYDAANRKIAETITGGELSLNASWEYNLAGQLIKSINYQGLSNIYTYIQGDNQSSNPHGETVTLLLPDNSTVITETYCDGSIANISGSSQVAKYFDKGVNNDGSIWNKVNYAGGDSPRWDKQTSNLLGLPSRHEKSGYNGTVITDFFYNDKSQLIKETQTGKGTQLYIYNDIGNLYRTGIDIDNNGVLDISSNEPIIEQESYIDGVWEQQDIKVYGVHESATPTLIATYKRRLSGWGNNLVQELQSIDVWGNVKTTKQELDRANKTVTFSVLEPSSTVANQIIFINGLNPLCAIRTTW